MGNKLNATLQQGVCFFFRNASNSSLIDNALRQVEARFWTSKSQNEKRANPPRYDGISPPYAIFDESKMTILRYVLPKDRIERILGVGLTTVVSHRSGLIRLNTTGTNRRFTDWQRRLLEVSRPHEPV